jgi:hypothetical protein
VRQRRLTGVQLLKGLQEEGNGKKFARTTQHAQLIRTHLQIPLSTYLKQYKVGDIVDVVANGTRPLQKDNMLLGGAQLTQ